jgi:hypothetical protein
MRFDNPVDMYVDLKLSRRLKLIKYSLDISRVSSLKNADVSRTVRVSQWGQIVPETSLIFSQRTQLIAREDFINCHNDLKDQVTLPSEMIINLVAKILS